MYKHRRKLRVLRKKSSRAITGASSGTIFTFHDMPSYTRIGASTSWTFFYSFSGKTFFVDSSGLSAFLFTFRTLHFPVSSILLLGRRGRLLRLLTLIYVLNKKDLFFLASLVRFFIVALRVTLPSLTFSSEAFSLDILSFGLKGRLDLAFEIS